MNTYPADYKLIFVGDAAMSPYEITYPGGSVEHWNEEIDSIGCGASWMFIRELVWLNPVPEKYWDGTVSFKLMRQIMGGRMPSGL